MAPYPPFHLGGGLPDATLPGLVAKLRVILIKFSGAYSQHTHARLVTATYGTSIATDASPEVGIALITVTDGVAFTVANPTNASEGQTLTYDVLNSSGGAMGAITWGSEFKLAGAFTNPANTLRRTITFYRTAASTWVEVSRAANDI